MNQLAVNNGRQNSGNAAEDAEIADGLIGEM
jgi:hypothetical protein